HHAEPRLAGGDDSGTGQQDLSGPPGRQAPRRYDQDHHAAGTHRHPGSQRPALARETAGGSQITAIARGRQGMTVTRGLALILTVAAAGALVNASGPAAAPAATVRLKAISGHVNAKGASLVIEASEPVAYTATRPDPLTVLLDFRNVGSAEVANSFVADAKSPIVSVSVEAAESLGSPASRVRVVLAQPVAHRVRSERNTVVVDFDKPSAKAVPYVLPPVKESGPAPDAMLALQNAAADPIAALGLDQQAGGP